MCLQGGTAAIHRRLERKINTLRIACICICMNNKSTEGDNLNFINPTNFQSHEVMSRGSVTPLEVTENSDL